MPCFRPLVAWRGVKPNDNGKLPVAFRMREGDPDAPLDLPCGKCVGCIKDRATAWAIRCFHESQGHRDNCFLTLTYDDVHLPSDGKLSVPDAQKFIKRLRRKGVTLRYFLCGEYGSLTRRPHYHALVFGQDFLGGAEEVSRGKYFSPFLTEAWGNGHCLVSPMETSRIFYTVGYTLKNLDDPDCFHLMSRKPYIGQGWLATYHDQLVRLGFVVIDGKKYAVPKSYLERKEFALELDALNDSRRAYMARMPVEERVRRRDVARSREINLSARVSRGKGDL